MEHLKKLAENRTLLVLCGESVLSACQVVRSYVHNLGMPRSIYLICTQEVREGAGRLVDFLRDEFLRNSLACPQCSIELFEISKDGKAENLPTVVEAYARFEREGPLVVNLSGGTNLMNVTGLLALGRDDTLFVLAGEKAFFCAWQQDGEFQKKNLPLAPPLLVNDLLRLQGVAWSQSTLRKDELRALSKKAQFQWPKYCDKYLQTDLAVGGVHFDAVWNPGDNKLHFLVINQDWNRGTRKSRLAETRDLLDLALGRGRLHHLYDRKIAVLEADHAALERFELEGQGKLRAYPLPNSDLKESLAEIFAQPPQPRKHADRKPLEIVDLQGDVLVTAIGPNPLPALLAISAHQAKEVLLCVSDEPPSMKKMASLLKEKAEERGLARVQIISCSPEGLDLLPRLPVLTGSVAVNITAGTKGQGASLALWAKKHGHAVWSLDSAQNQVVCLSAPGQSLPLPMPPFEILLYCLSKGRKRAFGLNYNCTDRAGLKKREKYSDMLCFMRAVDEAKLWESFFSSGSLREPLEAGAFRLQFNNIKDFFLTQKAHGQTRRPHEYTLDGGGFYECLVGEALAEIGQELDIRLNVTTWRESSIDEPLTELDVVACAHGKLYVISCKSRPMEMSELVETVREVRNTARNLSRFAVPLLACLYERSCREVEGVMVIGPDVLCQPGRLQQALDVAVDMAVNAQIKKAG